MNRLWIAAALWLIGFAVMLLAILLNGSDVPFYTLLGAGLCICVVGAVVGVASADDI